MDRGIALLTSIGSGICGAAAILGAEKSTIQTKPYKTAVAVSTVVIFGTISMFIYPILYHNGTFVLSANEMGIFTGATLHEVAHTVGAGNAMGKNFRCRHYRKNDSCNDAGSRSAHYQLHGIPTGN